MTSWLDRAADAVGRFLDGAVPEQRQSSGFSLNVPDYQIGKPRWPDANMGSYRQAYASTVAVYRCVSARAQAVSSAPVRVYQESSGDRTEIPEHPLRMLLQQPNPMMSEAEFMVMTQTLMDATGFAAIEKARAPAGNLIQLWHLRSDWLKEIKRSQKPSDWEYRVPGRQPIIIRAQNILIVPGGPSTDLGVIGMSPIAVALREVGIDQGLTDFLKLFIEGGGTPLHALVHPDRIEDQEEARDLREKFGYIYGGFRNWTKTVLLHGGLDYKRIGSNIEELAYPQLRSLTEAHICSVFGVPPIIAGIQAGIEASTYSNYEQARKAFFEDTVVALWARLDGALTRGLLPEFSDDQSISLEFDTSGVPALQEDQTALWSRVQAMLGTAGMTLNQAQAAVGLPGFGPAGDVLLLPINLQPTRPDDLAALADMTMEPPQPAPAALATGNGVEDENSGSQSDDEEEALRAIAGNGHLQARIRTLPLETRARIVTANRRNVSRLTAKFTPRLRAMFRRQGEKVAADYKKRGETLQSGASFASDSAKIETRALESIDWDELEGEMERELRALYEAAGKLAFESGAKQLGVGIAWDLSNPFVRQTINQLARRIVGVNQTTRKDVARVVADGIEEGLTTPQIADRLQGMFTETYRGRSMTIARSESMNAYNSAALLGYKQSGVVMATQMLDNPLHGDYGGDGDGLTCAERNGMVVSLEEAQRSVDGTHPNCVLAISPLLVTPLGSV